MQKVSFRIYSRIFQWNDKLRNRNEKWKDRILEKINKLDEQLQQKLNQKSFPPILLILLEEKELFGLDNTFLIEKIDILSIHSKREYISKAILDLTERDWLELIWWHIGRGQGGESVGQIYW